MANISTSTWTYTITEEDRLWAARMLQFEGGSPDATIWTMTQAYALPGKHGIYSTFTAFIRAFSQPINPIWALGGSRCPRASTDPNSPCFTRRLENRARAIQLPFSSTRREVQTTINSWFAGTLPNPVPKAVEFADQHVGMSYLARHPGSYIVLNSGNIYIATSASTNWGDNYVVLGPTTLAGSTAQLLAEDSVRDRLAGRDRAATLATSSRVGIYAAAGVSGVGTAPSAVDLARARADSRLQVAVDHVVRLPVIQNALGFNYGTGQWENRTSSSVASSRGAPPPADATTPPAEPTVDSSALGATQPAVDIATGDVVP